MGRGIQKWKTLYLYPDCMIQCKKGEGTEAVCKGYNLEPRDVWVSLLTHSSLLPRAILEAPVTEPRFLEQLQELDAKAAAVREQEARGTAACADVRGVLDRLRVKVKDREISLKLLEPASPKPSSWIFLAEFIVACPQDLHPAFSWQSSFPHL